MFKTCELCWASEYRSIPKTEHSYEEIKVIKAPTCLEDGEGELHCVACTSKKENVVIPATGVHLWGDWEITKEATATEHGEGTRVCSTCLETETVIHYYEDEGYYSVEPTCGTSGILVRHCVVCDQDVEEVVAPVGEHLWGPWEETKAPNCGYRGARVRKCLVCADIAEKLVILDNYNLVEHTYSPAMIGDYVETRGEHVYDEGKETASTCKMQGYKVYTCEVCERTKEETLPLKDHTWIETIVEATCTTEGSITRVCDVCRATESEVIPMHVAPVDENGDIVYTRIQTQPTCDTVGVAAYTCTVCNRPVRVELPALGHTNTTILVKSTCTKDGYKAVHCEICYKELSREVLPALGHAYDETFVDSTCTEDGVRNFVCASCGDTYTEIIPAKGHTGETTTVEPTCTEDGYVLTVCAVCKTELNREILPAFGHTEEGGVCTVCGETLFVCGDANGDGVLDGKDATRLLHYLANLDPSTGESTVEISAGADCNDDGVLDGRDCVRLLRYLASRDPVTGESDVVPG